MEALLLFSWFFYLVVCERLLFVFSYRLEDLRAEFDDFQENSRDLEAELETSLEQTEAKNRELLAKVQRLQDENDQMKVSASDSW